MAKKRVTLVKDFIDILMNKDFEACKKVFDKCEINAKHGETNAFGCRPLSREFAFWLKEQACDIEFKDKYGKTPIFYQYNWGYDNFDLFIELGADIFAKDKDGHTLLHLVASSTNREAIIKLVNHGYDINVLCEKTWVHPACTPLDYALIYKNFTLEEMLDFINFMLENKATINDYTKELITKKCEDFAFRKDSLDKEFVLKNQIAYDRLFELIGADKPLELQKHDGISDIKIVGEEMHEMFNNLFEFLVPGMGRAKSAQGECVRLIGRLSYEILDNGGINWNKDFKLMANTFLQYLKIGNALTNEDLEDAEKIIKKISINTSKGDIYLLMSLAVLWVSQNPQVLPLLEAEYLR